MKLCECGCGKPAPIAKRNRPNYKKGDVLRFVSGHNPPPKLVPKRGAEHWNWKEGKTVWKGVVYVQDKRTKSGYIPEHVSIVEKVLKKRLPTKAVVHHHNGPSNEKSNLLVCENQAFHNLIHQRQRSFQATGNPNNYKCRYCKTWDETVINAKDGNSYHRDCDNVRRKKLHHKTKGTL